MQLNGGFFGSMTPQGATSFMPQGASPEASIGGIGGSPDALASPPMGQNVMAALAALSKMAQNQGGGNSGTLPPNSFSPFMPNGGQPAPGNGAPPGQQPGAGTPPAGQATGAPPQMNGILQMLQKMSPDQIKGIMSRLGVGAGAPKPVFGGGPNPDGSIS